MEEGLVVKQNTANPKNYHVYKNYEAAENKQNTAIGFSGCIHS